jgi:hypothetical protein
MKTATPDRRILKAFYTQYVAVLLIVLVFVVSGFQGYEQQTEVASSPRVQKQAAPFGAISLRMPEVGHHGLTDDIMTELNVVAEFVRSHDIRATFRIPVFAEGDKNVSAALKNSIAYSSQVRDYMLTLGVPAQAMRTVLFEAKQVTSTVSVTFSSMEEINDHG